MTEQTAPEAPPEAPPAPDLTLIRYRRDGGSAWRVFHGGDPLGRIETRRVVVTPSTGRKAERWFYTPARLAWGAGAGAVPVPPEAMVGAEMGPVAGGSRADAARFLVEYLRRHDCPAVRELYG